MVSLDPVLQGTVPQSLPPQPGGKGSMDHGLREAFGKEFSEPPSLAPYLFELKLLSSGNSSLAFFLLPSKPGVQLDTLEARGLQPDQST